MHIFHIIAKKKNLHVSKESDKILHVGGVAGRKLYKCKLKVEKGHRSDKNLKIQTHRHIMTNF